MARKQPRIVADDHQSGRQTGSPAGYRAPSSSVATSGPAEVLPTSPDLSQPLAEAGRDALLRLQRAVGNRVTCRLLAKNQQENLQRKPADIDTHWPLNYNSAGKLTNVAAGRATLKAATAINSQLRHGLVKPLEELTGGHLMKREFGGPDDETNVVPWKQDVEDDFGVFENDYFAAANAKASTAATTSTPYQADVHTKATFVDRPDLQASEAELDTAGWPSPDAERTKRKQLFDHVADKFSGIPTTVSVDVTIEPSDVRKFSRAGLAIAPAYTRNDDALKPGYVMQAFKFTPHATEPRNWVNADWSNQKDKIRQQIQHEWKHAVDFGVTGGFNPTNGQAFEKALKTFILEPTHQQIVGVYRKEPVLHYVDATSAKWVATKPDGTYMTSWKLAPDQLTSVLTKGLVR